MIPIVIPIGYTYRYNVYLYISSIIVCTDIECCSFQNPQIWKTSNI